MNYQICDSNKTLACEQSSATPLFSRLAWLSLFEQYICNKQFAAMTLVFSNQQKQLILPLAKHSFNGLRALQSLTNYYSPFYQMQGSQLASAKDYVDAVLCCRSELSQYDVIDLLPLYQHDAKTWQRAFNQIGFKGFCYEHSINWYHENITDVDQFWSLRPSKLRNTLKRKKHKLDQSGEYSTRVVAPQQMLRLNQALAHYHHVYYDSWKKIEPYPAFIDAIAQYAWQQGELRLGLIYHKQVPVAAQIWFVSDQTAYIFKLAYRKQYTKTSVGTVLTAAMMEYVIDKDKVTCIDFLTGDDSFKKDWMQSKRTLMGVQACNLTRWRGKKIYLKNILSGIRKNILSP